MPIQSSDLTCDYVSDCSCLLWLCSFRKIASIFRGLHFERSSSVPWEYPISDIDKQFAVVTFQVSVLYQVLQVSVTSYRSVNYTKIAILIINCIHTPIANFLNLAKVLAGNDFQSVSNVCSNKQFENSRR